MTTTNTAHPLDFDEGALDAYYTNRDAQSALVDDSQCEGFGCVDLCSDCAPTCPFCGNAPHAHMCEPLRAAMGDASDIQANLSRLVDKDAEIAALRQQIEHLQVHTRYMWSLLRGAWLRREAK
jgi:3-methyladenine DNA glycosylase/8-oxoguanine DNA glycosylase